MTHIHCLTWYSVSWLTLKGKRSVKVLAEVTPKPGQREIHEKRGDGSWLVTREPCEVLDCYVESVRDEKDRVMDFGAFSSGERNALYEAVRAEYEKARSK